MAALDDVGHQGGDALAVGKAQQVGHRQGDVHGVDDLAPQGVLDVVVDVGNLVGQTHYLSLQGGGLLALGVADNAVAHLPGEVQALAPLFQPVHHPQGLLIVGKAAGHKGAEQPLSRVAKRGVSQVMAQSDSLGQVLVEPQGPGNGAGDAVDLQGVGHPGAVVVPLGLEEDLGLVLEAAKRLAVHNAVDVPLKAGTDGALLFLALPAPTLVGAAGVGGEEGVFLRQALFPDRHRH